MLVGHSSVFRGIKRWENETCWSQTWRWFGSDGLFLFNLGWFFSIPAVKFSGVYKFQRRNITNTITVSPVSPLCFLGMYSSLLKKNWHKTCLSECIPSGRDSYFKKSNTLLILPWHCGIWIPPQHPTSSCSCITGEEHGDRRQTAMRIDRMPLATHGVSRPLKNH